MKHTLFIIITILLNKFLFAQNEIRITPITSYYLQNSYMDIGIYNHIGNSNFVKKIGFGGKVEFAHYFTKHWSYQIGLGITNTNQEININFPLNYFSKIYNSDKYDYTYQTDNFSRLEFNLGLTYTAKLSNLINFETYFNLLPIWELKKAKETNISNYFKGSNDIEFRIYTISGRIGYSGINTFPINVFNPCSELGFNFIFNLGSVQNMFTKNDRTKFSYLFGLSYSGTVPFLEGGINSWRITTYDETGKILERALWWDRANRLNCKIGIIYKLK